MPRTNPLNSSWPLSDQATVMRRARHGLTDPELRDNAKDLLTHLARSQWHPSVVARALDAVNSLGAE